MDYLLMTTFVLDIMGINNNLLKDEEAFLSMAAVGRVGNSESGKQISGNRTTVNNN